MTILTRISAALDNMTLHEKQIARFILEQPERVCQLTSSELAEVIGTSQSGIVKFSKKQGLAGFSQLKMAVNEAVARRHASAQQGLHGTINATDSLNEVSLKLLGSKLHCLRETIELNKEAVILQALEFLDGARRIHLSGVGSSSLVARDFQFKLLKLGRVAIHDRDSHVQIANASTMTQNDVLLALSHSGTSREIIEIADVAKVQGAKIISISRPTENPLTARSDISLYTVADEEKARVSSITARDAQLLLIDLLFIQLAQRQPNAGEYVRKSREAVEKLKKSKL
ncbi:TPA: MurR/RpiR family transcriptional regulator [Klebsiella pneumoniae]|uniref:Sialic acid utilization regulator n=1 Tax=Klebsiella pneumoniae TaxID=573 RepID=A0A378CID2_KLEPN|nr:MurR/RpiR family transcriptional regulator [Serratia marcescens]AYJ96707.1 MurR/RpiR family transcriptional regulator [Klebsiella pneumoniae]CAI2019132.1 MurPQ operon repressor [Serratia marcescens]SQC25046.1 Sialic acid utilization regulator [Klebsiella pneumoniae]STU16780.1 Sialic acid utilization regulator [Klebsiella pneumoniae]STU17128.1 Sialic acid utilization regulator [Klebsiella pneumoniae]